MRLLAFASLLILAGCSEEPGGGNKAAGGADKASLKLAAGQWETVSEVTDMKQEDQGAPAMKADAGTKMTVSNCIGEAEGKKPPASVLAGIEGADCQYQNIYMSRGKLNASMSCTRPGLSGQILVSTEGSYTDKSFDLTSNVRTMLATDGDISFNAKVVGRHIGACAAGPAKAA